MLDEFPNWFEGGAEIIFKRHLTQYSGGAGLKYLQLGAYTGDCSRWLLENVLTDPSSTLYDVDTWEGSPTEVVHNNFNWTSVEQTYNESLSSFPNVKPYKMTTDEFFSLNHGVMFDFIYIDADHIAKAVYDDAVNALKVLKPGGILAFDDVLWEHESRNPLLSPKLGILRFANHFSSSLLLLDIGMQAWFIKK